MADSKPLVSPLPAEDIDRLVIGHRRGALARTLHRLSTGALTIGFVGGSITAEYGTGHNWPNPLASWFAETFREVRITVENAAIGATGSDSACLRVEREIIARHCDLTFVEYAVNDYDDPTPLRNHSREGLIRKLLAAGQDVILVYTYRQSFYPEMIAGSVPASIAEFEVIAEHYGLSSVWVGLAALREVRAGHAKWEDWLPDGLHPQFHGSWIYAQAIIAHLRVWLAKDTSALTPPLPNPVLPAPLFSRNWQDLTLLPLASVRTVGPWLLKRFNSLEHVDQALETHTPGARLEFDFSGRGIILIFQYGKRSSEFNYRVDGGEWIAVQRPRYDWSGDRNMVRATFLTEDLSPGAHSFEMIVTHGDRTDCTGTECRLVSIGILP